MGQTRVVAGAGRHPAAEAGPVWAAGPLDAEAAKQQTVDINILIYRGNVNLAVKVIILAGIRTIMLCFDDKMVCKSRI